mgnify:CR=1 FL=1
MKLLVLRLAMRDHDGDDRKTMRPWPTMLWRKEENAIRADLMEKMDTMQRLLMTRVEPNQSDVPQAAEAAIGVE